MKQINYQLFFYSKTLKFSFTTLSYCKLILTCKMVFLDAQHKILRLQN